MAYCELVGPKTYKIKYDIPPVNGRSRQQKTETLRNVTNQQALAISAKRKEAALRGEFSQTGSMTLNELFDKFIAQKETSGKSPATMQRYNGIIDLYFRPRFGEMKARDLRTHHLLEAYAGWAKSRKDGRTGTLSPTTVKHINGTIRNVLNRAVPWDIVDKNVSMQIDSDDLPKMKKPVANVLDGGQLNVLLAEAKSPSSRSAKKLYLSSYAAFYPATFFSAYTGARRGEVLALKWSSLDLESGMVTIASSLSDTRSGGLFIKPPKNGETRKFSIASELVEVLREHRNAQQRERLALGAAYKSDGFVFAKPNGEPIRPLYFTAAFSNLIERTTLPTIRLHDLRATHISLMRKAGVDMSVIIKRVGHATSLITQQRYLRIYDESDTAASRAFADISVTDPLPLAPNGRGSHTETPAA